MAILLAALTSLALTSPVRIPELDRVGSSDHPIAVAIAKLPMVTNESGLQGAVLICLLTCFYLKTMFAGERKKVRISTLLFSFFFSVCLLIGASFTAYNDLNFMLGNPFQMVYSLMLLLGYIPFVYLLVEIALSAIGKRMTQKPIQTQRHRWIAFLVDCRPFLIPLLICFICWLPYWLVHFPGSITVDESDQLMQYFGLLPYNNHHPIVGTLLFGSLMRMGRMLHSDNAGVALIALFQHLLLASACAYSMVLLKRWGLPRAVRVGSLLFFALHPLIAYYPQVVMKDTISMALMLFFAGMYMEVIRRIRMNLSFAKLLLVCVLVGMLSALIRHNNLYIAIVSLALLPVFKQPVKQRILCAAAGILCFVLVTTITSVLISALGASPGSVREMLSLPFQQTARYLRDHKDDVLPQEENAIRAVLDYDNLASLYNPTLSDPVKNTYTEKGEMLPAYGTAWWSMFQRHPDSYILAALNQSYSYYTPFGGTANPLYYAILMRLDSLHFFYIHHMFFPETAVLSLGNWVMWGLQNIPGVSILYHVGNYTWFGLLLAIALFQKRKIIFLLGFMPFFLHILTCIASPVNGLLRYFLPSLVMVPLLFAWMIYGVYLEPTQKKMSEPQNLKKIPLLPDHPA